MNGLYGVTLRCMKIIVYKISGNKRCEVEVPDHTIVCDLRQVVRDRECFPRDRSFSALNRLAFMYCRECIDSPLGID